MPSCSSSDDAASEPNQPLASSPKRPLPPKSKAAPKKSKTDIAIEQAIKELVKSAPPLTPEMKARLAEIFSITRHYRN